MSNGSDFVAEKMKFGLGWTSPSHTSPLFVILLIFFTKIMSNHKCYCCYRGFTHKYTVHILLVFSFFSLSHKQRLAWWTDPKNPTSSYSYCWTSNHRQKLSKSLPLTKFPWTTVDKIQHCKSHEQEVADQDIGILPPIK